MRLLLKLLPPTLRDEVIRRGFSIDEDAIRNLRVKVASTPDEHTQAARLLQEMYERRGIAVPHPSGVRVQSHHLLPSTVTFVARDLAAPGAPVVGTMSLIVDSPLGLPMDTIYASELAPLRAEKRRIAEVGGLCLAANYRNTGAMYLLCRIMHDYAVMAGCDDLVIAVHPDVADYYRANMDFELVGGVREYPGLRKSALARALRLNLRGSRERTLERFGDKPSTANLHYLWFTRENPQIEAFDASDFGLRRHLKARREAALHLAALRPDVVSALSDAHAHHLAQVVPQLAPLLHRSTPAEDMPVLPRSVTSGFYRGF